LPGDLAYFKRLTTETRDASKQNVVIMGRKTWESIPDKFRPLPGRCNIVLSRSHGSSGSMGNTAYTAATSLEDALKFVGSNREAYENVYVIGGGELYKEAMVSPQLTAIHLTLVEGEVECDTFMPSIDTNVFKLWHAGSPRRDASLRYSFLCYTRTADGNGEENDKIIASLPACVVKQHEEFQYLDMIKEIIDEGIFRGDRTGTGTFSKFGKTMRFNLRHTFPLLTTKRVFWRGLAEELLWFVKGSTNATELADKGIHIWDGNGSREYLDSIGLTEREEGDLGPVYGFQWRHFGAEYSTMHEDYTGKGVDQLAELIHKIKTNPTDRRLVLTAWNPLALPEMALPPCHMFCQFYVADGELSCQMYQRSCDLGLGVPFNIASYALLTRMIAQVCDLAPGDFVHVLGDAHVYSNHVDPLKEQLLNFPRHLPTLKINPDKKNIDDFTFDDFEIIGYAPHKKIQMTMAV
jgi:dihydrofolate reductase/thymidylate synthase